MFYLCQACHSLKTVLQQRLSREVWDETLVWMIEEQGMPAPESADYARLLDYLRTNLSPEAPRYARRSGAPASGRPDRVHTPDRAHTNDR